MYLKIEYLDKNEVIDSVAIHEADEVHYTMHGNELIIEVGNKLLTLAGTLHAKIWIMNNNGRTIDSFFHTPVG